MLIDSGSTKNIISRKVMKIINFKTINHPKPYKIRWVKKGINIKVTKMCNISFFIGFFFINDVLCDVIDRDACHLILGKL